MEEVVFCEGCHRVLSLDYQFCPYCGLERDAPGNPHSPADPAGSMDNGSNRTEADSLGSTEDASPGELPALPGPREADAFSAPFGPTGSDIPSGHDTRPGRDVPAGPEAPLGREITPRQDPPPEKDVPPGQDVAPDSEQQDSRKAGDGVESRTEYYLRRLEEMRCELDILESELDSFLLQPVGADSGMTLAPAITGESTPAAPGQEETAHTPGGPSTPPTDCA